MGFLQRYQGEKSSFNTKNMTCKTAIDLTCSYDVKRNASGSGVNKGRSGGLNLPIELARSTIHRSRYSWSPLRALSSDRIWTAEFYQRQNPAYAASFQWQCCADIKLKCCWYCVLRRNGQSSSGPAHV
jgi:hypothetical protein